MQRFWGAVFGEKLNIAKRPFVKIDFEFARKLNRAIF